MINPVKARTRSHGHFMRNRAWEMAIGFAFVVIGCILLWDAFDNRGKKMPWPISGLQPW